MTELTDENWYTEIGRDGVVVVDVYATWCEPCGRMLKLLPRLETALTDVARLCKLDFDKNTEFVSIYNITSIPTFLFFKNGSEVQRFTGIKPLAEVEQIARSL